MSRLAALLLALLQPQLAAAEVLTLPTGRGEATLRVLVLPPSGPPRGAVVLLAGGDGELGLTEAGTISSLAGNQLVRTRADYVAAGYLVALPDMATDSWRRRGARVSPEHAADLGKVVALLRPRAPWVALLGTSRGTLSAANAAARLTGAEAPDALALTAGMLMADTGGDFSVQGIPGIERIAMPVLLLHHSDDQCRITPPSGPARLQPLLVAAQVRVVMLSGGSGYGNMCEGRSAHGFNGIDDQVVATMTQWLAGVTARPARP